MRRLNQDTIIAILLLMASGVLFWETMSIRSPDYGVLKPATWPQVIIVAMALLSAIYLIQSIKQGASDTDADPDAPKKAARDAGVLNWFIHWKNPIFCFTMFLFYLLTLPILGSLIGGVIFVFTLMGILGGFAPKKMVVHAALALATVGGMWAIFTYGLEVILPPGLIFSPF